MQTTEKIDYDAIPVTYCKRCHSLRILAGNGFPDYCERCGSTDLGDELINEWLEEEEEIKKNQTKSIYGRY